MDFYQCILGDMLLKLINHSIVRMAQSAGATEYTDCIYAEA